MFPLVLPFPRAHVLCTVFALLCMSCGAGFVREVRGTGAFQGVRAVIRAERIEGQQLLVTIRLAGMPQAGSEGAHALAAWVLVDGQLPVRVGALLHDAGTRTARIMVTTVHRTFRLRITSEENAATGANSQSTTPAPEEPVVVFETDVDA